ncbi:MAG: O-antigen ligase family protein [Candidatus Omnitrophota bacterium]
MRSIFLHESPLRQGRSADLLRRNLNLIHNRISSGYVIILVFVLAYLSGTGLLKSIQGFSLGSFIRGMAPAALIGILILPVYFLRALDIRSIIFGGFNVSLKTITLISGLAVILGVLLPWSFFSYFGTMTFLLIAFVALLFIISLYLIFTNKSYLAVLSFLCAFPVFSYLENWFINVSDTAYFSLSFLVITPTTIFILGIFIATLITQPKLTKIELNRYILLFLGVCVAASLFSGDPVISLKELSLELGFPIMVYFMLIRNIRTRHQVKLLRTVLIILVVLISIINLYLYRKYQQGADTAFNVYGELFQTGATSSVWASMIMMVLPLALVLEIKSKSVRIVFNLIVVFLLGCIFITYSRAAQLCSFIVLLILFLSIKKTRKFLGIFLVIFALLSITHVGFLKNTLIERYQTMFSPDIDISRDTSYMHRVDAWQASVQIIKRNPLLGVGNGLWKDHIYLYAPKQLIITQNRQVVEGYIATPHNYYLKVMVDSGIFALAAYLILLIMIFKTGLKFVYTSKNQQLKEIVTALLLSLLSWVLFSLVLDNFYQGTFMGPGIIFWTIVAMIAMVTNLKEEA